VSAAAAESAGAAARNWSDANGEASASGIGSATKGGISGRVNAVEAAPKSGSAGLDSVGSGAERSTVSSKRRRWPMRSSQMQVATKQAMSSRIRNDDIDAN